MFVKKVFSFVKLIFLKIKYGKRLVLKSVRHTFKADTEISVAKDASLTLGRVSFRTNVHILCDHGEMYIGNRVCFNRNCIAACRRKIVIGDKCLFGPNVCIYDHDHVYTSDGVSPVDFKCSEVIIEEGCWIGAGAIILRGTHIGKNSVVEAGTVVKGNISANSIVTTVRECRIIPATMFMKKAEAPVKH